MKKLQNQLSKLNSRTENLLDEMSLAGPKSITRPPVEDAWTPLQALHHIILVERHTLDYLLYKLGSNAELPPLTLADRIKGKLISAALASPLKFKSPKDVDSALHTPKHKLNLDTLAHELRTVRDELKQLYLVMPPDWKKKAVFRHPSGRIGIDDVMLFLETHYTRHERQIKRGLAQNARYYRRQKAS